MYHVPLAVQCTYMDGMRKEVKIGTGRRGVSSWKLGESGDYITSCIVVKVHDQSCILYVCVCVCVCV